MPLEFTLRITTPEGLVDVVASLTEVGPSAATAFGAALATVASAHVLLIGDRDYCASVDLTTPAGGETRREMHPTSARGALELAAGHFVTVVFPGRRPVRRFVQALKLAPAVAGSAGSAPVAKSVDLADGVTGRAPLWLRADGTFTTVATEAQVGMAARDALVNAARWVSGRRTTTFERLFAQSAFHPDLPARPERVSELQALAMLAQIQETLRAAAVEGVEATLDPEAAAQVRSACLTVLSHMIATVLREPSWRPVADLCAAAVFGLIEAETSGPAGRPALRAHAILLLQLRAPALNPADGRRALALVKTLSREAPPYDRLEGPWSFAMASAPDFHDGECEVLVRTHGFQEVPPPSDAPAAPYGQAWRCFEAPFRAPAGQVLRVMSRRAQPSDENAEMASEFFVGVLINRHAQLGSFDMRASERPVVQRGYKLMMNSQCAGLTTRFALSRLFPDADLYSSWDSTYFRTDRGGKVTASEGLDCFVAMLRGLSRRETHAQLDARARAAQWHHPQADVDPDFTQFVGPAHPLVIARYSDVNHDARADSYDGFLDFTLHSVALEMADAVTPRAPGAAVSQIGGDAARSLGWATGSMNRATQYSDLWEALPGRSELFYIFEAAGYFSHLEPPGDVRTGPYREDLGLLPSVCRYVAGTETGTDAGTDAGTDSAVRAEVMFHAWLSHAPEELKRLLVAAEAMNRAFDLKLLPSQGRLGTPQARRGALLLTMAGLLEFPADQNRLDGLWATALRMLNLPDISRTLVRRCITTADHDASNYYGSVRGLAQLVGAGADQGELGKADPLAWSRLASADPSIGRAAALTIP